MAQHQAVPVPVPATHEFSRIAYHGGIQLSLYDRPAAAGAAVGAAAAGAAAARAAAAAGVSPRDCGIEMLDHRPHKSKYRHNYRPFALEIPTACREWIADNCSYSYRSSNKIKMGIKMQFNTTGSKVLLWSGQGVVVLHNADMLTLLQPAVDQLDVAGEEMNLTKSPGQLG